MQKSKIDQLEAHQRRLIEAICYFEPRLREVQTDIEQIVRADRLRSCDTSLAILCTNFSLMMLKLSEINAQLEDARGNTGHNRIEELAAH